MTTPTTQSLTPEQLIALLIQELSASGSVPIVSADGTTNLTWRQAFAQEFVKVTGLLDLLDRPVDPSKKDDLYGHILSLRAEVLQLLALGGAIATALNLNVDQILNTATAAFQPNS